MTDNYPLKSIRSIMRDMGVSQFLIRQVGQQDIRCISYKGRKRQLLFRAIKSKWRGRATSVLNKLKHPLQLNMPWFCRRRETFQPGPDCEHMGELLTCREPKHMSREG